MQSAHPRACWRDGSREQRPGPGLPWPCPRPGPQPSVCTRILPGEFSTALLCKHAGQLRPLGFRLQLRVDLGTLVSCLVPSQQQRPSCSHQPARPLGAGRPQRLGSCPEHKGSVSLGGQSMTVTRTRLPGRCLAPSGFLSPRQDGSAHSQENFSCNRGQSPGR